MKICRIEHCFGEAGLPGTSDGLCRSHYKRFYRYGNAEVELRKVASWRGQSCWVKGCGKPVMAHGVCEMHYARVRRKQNPEAQRIRNRNYSERQRKKRIEAAGRPCPDLCEICGEFNIRIVFDHCHAGGHFRGWICDRCNRVLGLVKDSPLILSQLKEYLSNGVPQNDSRSQALITKN